MTAPAPTPVDALIARLRAFAREHLHGRCKMLSLGDACPCNLCAVDSLAAALAVQQERIAELTGERDDWVRRLKLNDVTPMEWMTRALAAEVEADVESEMTDEWRARAERAEAKVAELEQSNEVLRSLYDAKIPIHERRRLPNAVWDERDDPLTASFWPDCTCVECYALHEMAVARAALRQAEADARRYRWLRNQPTTYPDGTYKRGYRWYNVAYTMYYDEVQERVGDELDAAIDAAIDAAQPGGEKEG